MKEFDTIEWIKSTGRDPGNVSIEAHRLLQELAAHLYSAGEDRKKIRIGCPTCKHDDYNSGRNPEENCPHAETCGPAFKHWEEHTEQSSDSAGEEVTDEEIEKQANAESGKSAYPDSHNAHRDYIAFIAGASWMRDKHLTYQPVSEEDVKKAFQEYIKEWGLNPSVDKAFRHGFKAAIKELNR